MRRLRAEDRIREHEAEILAHDGRWVECRFSLALLRDSAGAMIGTLAILEDTSERKRLEAQLRQAQKMEAVGRLAGGIAHDFNNLLAVIMGHSDLIRSVLKKGDALAHDVEQIRRASERAASLTRQLLAFSRRQVLQPQVIDVNTLVGNLATMLRRLIGEDIHLELRLDADRGPRVGGPGAARAGDHEPRGQRARRHAAGRPPHARDRAGGARPGVRRRRTRARAAGAARAALHPRHRLRDGAGRHGAPLRALLHDQGAGPGDGARPLHRLRHRQAAPAATSTSSARSGGAARSASTFRGSTRAPRPSGATPRERLKPGSRETVLFVEDEVALRDLMHRVLVKGGYTVLAAGDGVEALALGGGAPGPIDLVVTDVIMPRMSGPELADPAPRAGSGDPACSTSPGTPPTSSAPKADLGAEATLLAKPFTSDGLLRKVREVLDQPRGSPPGQRVGALAGPRGRSRSLERTEDDDMSEARCSATLQKTRPARLRRSRAWLASGLIAMLAVAGCASGKVTSIKVTSPQICDPGTGRLRRRATRSGDRLDHRRGTVSGREGQPSYRYMARRSRPYHSSVVADVDALRAEGPLLGSQGAQVQRLGRAVVLVIRVLDRQVAKRRRDVWVVRAESCARIAGLTHSSSAASYACFLAESFLSVASAATTSTATGNATNGAPRASLIDASSTFPTSSARR